MVNDASGNVKELIPEFFMEDSSFLLNKQQLDLGLATGNIQVNVIDEIYIYIYI